MSSVPGLCFALVWGDTLGSYHPKHCLCSQTRGGLDRAKAKAMLVTPGERPLEAKPGLASPRWKKGRGCIFKKISNEPNNIGNNTFGNTSVRSRVTLHVIHMHRSAQEKCLIIVDGMGVVRDMFWK